MTICHARFQRAFTAYAVAFSKYIITLFGFENANASNERTLKTRVATRLDYYDCRDRSLFNQNRFSITFQNKQFAFQKKHLQSIEECHNTNDHIEVWRSIKVQVRLFTNDFFLKISSTLNIFKFIALFMFSSVSDWKRKQKWEEFQEKTMHW